MKKRLSEDHRKKKGHLTVCGWLLGAALLFFCTAFPIQAENDLLLIPAEKSDMAPFSILMDVADVNGRLIAVGERGHILYSDDDCTGWVQADVPVSVTLTGVCFPTNKKGWAVGHDGVVLHSEDGGKTWKKQLDGIKINEILLVQLKQLIKDKNEQLESLETVPEEEQEEPLIQADEDAEPEDTQEDKLTRELENLDYFLSDAELAVKEGPTRPLMDLWFKNDREGIVIGAFGMILATTDGGETWKPLLDRIENPDGLHYYAICRSGGDLFIAGEAGMLFRSDDFGQTWQRLSSPYEGSYFGIIGKPDGGFIAAFGLRGNIYYSHDRGQTWVPANTGSKASLSGGAFLSDGSFCVAGVDGSILRSTDEGKTFVPLAKRFPGSIALTEAKNSIVVVVGVRGVARMEVNN